MAIRGSGELKVQFYAHLDEIKDLYFNQGFVIFKILHRELVKKYALTLDYQAFCYYARKELKKKQREKVIIKDENISSNSESQTSIEDEPKVAIIEYKSIQKIKKNTRAKRESIG